ncbi:MAG: DUF1249 domain-containing protein [Candidatus Sedimenticola sp. PURPLELP]
MRAPYYPWSLHTLASGRPTVGWLMDLCDENYQLMLKLAPALRSLQGIYLSRLEGSMDLYMEILEQTPYTSLVHLTYYFQHEEEQRPDPDARVRVYYDSSQVEVLDLRQRALPLERGIDSPSLDQKWKANLFLSKWLSFCVLQGHAFGSHQEDDENINKING